MTSPTTAFQSITLSTDSRGVATLTLSRAAQHNALSAEMIAELTQAAAALANDPSIRVVILTGAGASFCAGGDLNWMKAQVEADRTERISQSRKLALMLKALRDLPKPLIARVNGQAYGGGVGLISICDAAIAVSDARFGLTETRLGLIPATISPYVIARIGAANAMRYFTSARIFDATEARTAGLLNAVVNAETLDDAIEAEIAPYFATAPAAVAAAKALVHAISAQLDAAIIEDTLTRLADTWETPEATEGISAFLQKRPPAWKTETR